MTIEFVDAVVDTFFDDPDPSGTIQTHTLDLGTHVNYPRFGVAFLGCYFLSGLSTEPSGPQVSTDGGDTFNYDTSAYGGRGYDLQMAYFLTSGGIDFLEYRWPHAGAGIARPHFAAAVIFEHSMTHGFSWFGNPAGGWNPYDYLGAIMGEMACVGARCGNPAAGDGAWPMLEDPDYETVFATTDLLGSGIDVSVQYRIVDTEEGSTWGVAASPTDVEGLWVAEGGQYGAFEALFPGPTIGVHNEQTRYAGSLAHIIAGDEGEAI